MVCLKSVLSVNIRMPHSKLSKNNDLYINHMNMKSFYNQILMNAFYRRTAVILKLLPETRVELLNKNLSPIWFTQDQILQLLNLKKKQF